MLKFHLCFESTEMAESLLIDTAGVGKRSEFANRVAEALSFDPRRKRGQLPSLVFEVAAFASGDGA